MSVDDVEGLLAHEVGHVVSCSRVMRAVFWLLLSFYICASLLVVLRSRIDLIIAICVAALMHGVWEALLLAFLYVSLVFAFVYLSPILLFRWWVRWSERKADEEAVRIVGCEKVLGFYREACRVKMESHRRRGFLGRVLEGIFVFIFKPYRRYVQVDLRERLEWVEGMCGSRIPGLRA